MRGEHNTRGVGRLGRLRGLITKESFQIRRDPSSILIAFILPFVLLFLFGYGVSLDTSRIKVGLVLEGNTPDAQSFARAFINSRFFNVRIARDRRVFEDELVAGNISGIVVVPSYFSGRLLRKSDVAPIQVIADGSQPNTANFVQSFAQGVWGNWLRQEALSNGTIGEPAIEIEGRFWFNEELESQNFLVPGAVAIIMTMIGTLLTALVIAREWERGTMEAMMATPISITELLIGKLVPYFVLGMGSMVFCVAVAILLFGLPFRGSFIILCIVSAIFLLDALGLGLLISTLARNQFVASQAAIVAAFLPAFLLSGFIFEISSMPKVIQVITYAMPARYFVSCLQTLFMAGNVISVILPNVAGMTVIALLIFTLTARKTKKRLD